MRVFSFEYSTLNACVCLQAPLLLCEIKLKRVYRSLGLPQPNIWLSRLATIAFLLYVARYWFFSPVDKDSRLADMVKDQVRVSAVYACRGAHAKPCKGSGTPASLGVSMSA